MHHQLRTKGALLMLLATIAATSAFSTSSVLGATSASSRSPSTWGPATAIRGFEPNNRVGFVGVSAISCAAAGNCSAIGSYPTSANANQNQGFVLGERSGKWGAEQAVPGLDSLAAGHNAYASAISCAAVGECAAGGQYADQQEAYQGFVVDEVHGSWGTAEALPGLGALNVGGYAQILSVSCGAVGNCAAVGTFEDAQKVVHGFVSNETGGAWGTAQLVPGLDTLSGGRDAQLQSVSCPAAGNCFAGGQIFDANYVVRDFVVAESNGAWEPAQALPVVDTGNYSSSSPELSVSCGAPDRCAVAGTYADSKLVEQVFALTASDGRLGKAQILRGLGGASSHAANAQDVSMSCTAGLCAVVGGTQVPFVADIVGGVLGPARTIDGLDALDGGGQATMQAVSCGAPGDCTAGGYLVPAFTSGGETQAFVVDERNGRWGAAQEIRPGGPRNLGDVAYLGLLSCSGARACAAAGYYIAAGGSASTGFVTSEQSRPPHLCSPSAGLTASVAGTRRVGASVDYRVVYTNRSAFGCELVGTPGAIAYRGQGDVPVGPPARRTYRQGLGLAIYLKPLAGKAETTFAINLAITSSRSCQPASVDGIIIRPVGVAQIMVPLNNALSSQRIVCRGLGSEAVFGFTFVA